MKTTTLLSTAFAALTSATAIPVSGTDFSNGKISLQLSIDLNQDVGALGANVADIFHFTSTHVVHAIPENVVNGTEPTGGLAGASGIFAFGINSHANMICYNITLHNFQGEFESPATTATHIHEAVVGASGPPRIAFPNPHPVGGVDALRQSIGCLQGPFLTGVMVEGKDSGEGFHVSSLETNPTAFMADCHSSLALPGAVRGQLA
ncbi:hypothetical protein P154DRAFT_518184 [Amniculicola lignicola CBS 123094]|uniref:CHRD domain-containing protein n=1 Tax=Amniculicola lignicola CBS 123094 TaxID=1392246 RepID=A0A6A5WXU7_9PLEO|nr:hypothetical protein P154DRAFT_518184 [Amniculicola lignicola CBS 123094]